jgi:transposase InsO family protein
VTLHRNARTCPKSRLLLVERVLSLGWPVRKAAEAAGISERRARHWIKRFRDEGEAGLEDRSSAPKRVANKTAAERVEAVLALRELRFTAAEIAESVAMAHSTVSAILKREGLGKLPPLEAEPDNRYERARPGELLHADVKKLAGIVMPGHRVTGNRRVRARGKAGWQFVHVMIDDCTRLAYVEILPDERQGTCVAFLRRAVAWFAGKGIQVERLMTDNGNGYRSHLHAHTCRELGIRQLFTEPYRPRTNGKAERFIRTLIEGWAYRATYANNRERAAALPAFMTYYNDRRPHRALGKQSPSARLAELNNLTGTYT